jgi:hypothetical protein
MFASKLVQFIKKCPRSHLIVLKCVHKCYLDKNKKPGGITHESLLETFNGHFARRMAIDKIQMNQLYEILKFLQNADIVQVNEGKKHSIQPLMLTKTRFSGMHASGK